MQVGAGQHARPARAGAWSPAGEARVRPRPPPGPGHRTRNGGCGVLKAGILDFQFLA